MIYIGIDPGKNGGIGIVKKDKVKAYDLPLWKDGFLKGHVNNKKLFWMLEEEIKDKCIIGFEKQSPQGNTGKKVSFSMGMNYYPILEVLIGIQKTLVFSVSVVEILPQQWKRTLGLLGKKGDSSLTKKKITEDFIKQVFPEIQTRTKRNKLLDGRCDALAIAEYLRRKY